LRGLGQCQFIAVEFIALQPAELPYQYGMIARSEQVSLLATLCEILTAVSGAYLLLALFLRFQTRQAPY
jgi:hypothetical protein